MSCFRCNLSACIQTMCRHCRRVTLGLANVVAPPPEGLQTLCILPCCRDHHDFLLHRKECIKDGFDIIHLLKPPNAAACPEMVYEA